MSERRDDDRGREEPNRSDTTEWLVPASPSEEYAERRRLSRTRQQFAWFFAILSAIICLAAVASVYFGYGDKGWKTIGIVLGFLLGVFFIIFGFYYETPLRLRARMLEALTKRFPGGSEPPPQG